MFKNLGSICKKLTEDTEASFYSIKYATDILAVTNEVQHTKTSIKHLKGRHQFKLRHSVIYKEYLWVNIDFSISNIIVRKWYCQENANLVLHNYPTNCCTNCSIDNFKEPEQKLRLTAFPTSFGDTCLPFL